MGVSSYALEHTECSSAAGSSGPEAEEDVRRHPSGLPFVG